MTQWQQCSIIGCSCRRRTPAKRDGIHDKEWICRGHWSMAAKNRRTLYLRVQRRIEQIWQGDEPIEDRKLVKVYSYLWGRIKNEIMQKAVGI